MSPVAIFFLGAACGALVGIFVMALAVSAGRADREIQRMLEEQDRVAGRITEDPASEYQGRLQEARRAYDAEQNHSND